MKAAFYQFNPIFGDRDKNLKQVSSALVGKELDLLVLPELFSTGYQLASIEEVAALSEPVDGGYTTEALKELSRKHEVHIVAGLLERDGDKYYNSAVLVSPDGFTDIYRKTHLFFEETLYFSKGDTGFKVWDIGICRLGIMICFDWFFPEAMRTLTLLGADVIAHPSNLVLPYCPDAMPIRCLENRVYSITANRVGTENRKESSPLTFIGKSEIVSPHGKILMRAGESEEVLMIGDIDPHTSRDKRLNPYNDLLKDRRIDMYK